ncbi:DUF1439 domain-containing protein [Oxalobacteraceae bacterium R-40]|uniref:DUF1439 domain-containing protein n=1 Tax=Keguizhuia sedimenti TaxID=3064264 RepID=A0ABU1BQ10_9BURK|nr:DUF1439 domain-containing protein [Oxalobacteraceae bacterium R-40]
MRIRFQKLAMLAMIFLLSSCASLLGSRNVELSLAQLQDAMARKFPFNSRYLELVDVRLTNPRLSLQPGTNRLITTMDASIAPPFMEKSWTGNFTMSSFLKVDPAKRAIMLDDPRMENIAIAGLTGPYAGRITKAVGLLAEQLLQDTPLYTFDAQDFRYAGAQFLPTKINTTSSGLVVTFEPAR